MEVVLDRVNIENLYIYLKINLPVDPIKAAKISTTLVILLIKFNYESIFINAVELI